MRCSSTAMDGARHAETPTALSKQASNSRQLHSLLHHQPVFYNICLGSSTLPVSSPSAPEYIQNQTTKIGKKALNTTMSSSQSSTSSPSNLPPLNSYITTHNSAGKAIATTHPASWWVGANQGIAFDVVYTTSAMPVDMNDDRDVKQHEDLMAAGKLGLVNRGGTVCRIVDFPPENQPLMHRTQSLDYGVVLEGSLEMWLDSGECHVLNRGDVAVQVSVPRCELRLACSLCCDQGC